MKSKKLLFLVVLIFTLLILQSCTAYKRTKLSFLVVDKNDIPVEDARVGVGFLLWKEEQYGVSETTNKSGIAVIHGKSATENAGFNVTKEGYYKSTGDYYFNSISSFRWLPWGDQVKVVLRKVENPVPMYARNMKFSSDKKKEIPELNKYIGFDLIKFDWVTPYGRGVTPDFLFKVEKDYKDKKNFKASMSLKFSNKYDGIILHKESTLSGSEFALPRYAPDAEYENSLLFEINRMGNSLQRNNDYYKQDNNYIFRVRSEETNGEHSKSMYGKIIGPIVFDPVFSETATIFFKYYLNADYTRNLEYDPKRNLFGKILPLEQAGIK